MVLFQRHDVDRCTLAARVDARLIVDLLTQRCIIIDIAAGTAGKHGIAAARHAVLLCFLVRCAGVVDERQQAGVSTVGLVQCFARKVTLRRVGLILAPSVAHLAVKGLIIRSMISHCHGVKLAGSRFNFVERLAVITAKVRICHTPGEQVHTIL